MTRPLPFFALGLLALGACRSSHAYREQVQKPVEGWSIGQRLWTPIKDAILDTCDVAGADLSIGQGAWVNAQATKILHAGVGYFDGQRRGLRPRALGVWSETRGEGGMSLFYWRDLHRQPVWGTSTLFADGASYTGFDLDHQNEDGHWTDFELGAHFLFIGAEVSVRPIEVVDAAISWGKVLFLPYYFLNAFWPRPDPDLKEDDSQAPLRKEGGDAAGYIYQPETPFFERSRDTRAGKGIDRGD